jgi:hypothetical protein
MPKQQHHPMQLKLADCRVFMKNSYLRIDQEYEIETDGFREYVHYVQSKNMTRLLR